VEGFQYKRCHPAMTADLDICRAAKLMIDEYSADVSTAAPADYSKHRPSRRRLVRAHWKRMATVFRWLSSLWTMRTHPGSCRRWSGARSRGWGWPIELFNPRLWRSRQSFRQTGFTEAVEDHVQ
jgi:hypothetical protein